MTEFERHSPSSVAEHTVERKVAGQRFSQISGLELQEFHRSPSKFPQRTSAGASRMVLSSPRDEGSKKPIQSEAVTVKCKAIKKLSLFHDDVFLEHLFLVKGSDLDVPEPRGVVC